MTTAEKIEIILTIVSDKYGVEWRKLTKGRVYQRNLTKARLLAIHYLHTYIGRNDTMLFMNCQPHTLSSATDTYNREAMYLRSVNKSIDFMINTKKAAA